MHWRIALFEYGIQVPANRIGYTTMSLAQLKMRQEAIALLVFVPFAVLYMKPPIKLDYLWRRRASWGRCISWFAGSRGEGPAELPPKLVATSCKARSCQPRMWCVIQTRHRDLFYPQRATIT